MSKSSSNTKIIGYDKHISTNSKVITNNHGSLVHETNNNTLATHNQRTEWAKYDHLVEGPPQEGGGKIYTVDNVKFKTNDKHPEYIAAKIVQPSRKNCHFLITLNNKLYKCVKKNKRIVRVTSLY